MILDSKGNEVVSKRARPREGSCPGILPNGKLCGAPKERLLGVLGGGGPVCDMCGHQTGEDESGRTVKSDHSAVLS